MLLFITKKVEFTNVSSKQPKQKEKKKVLCIIL